jgi:hypothetical protein
LTIEASFEHQSTEHSSSIWKGEGEDEKKGLNERNFFYPSFTSRITAAAVTPAAERERERERELLPHQATAGGAAREGSQPPWSLCFLPLLLLLLLSLLIIY